MTDDMNKRRDELADKRSKRQCTTGNQDLDKAIAWYLKIGFEDGWDAGVSEMQAQNDSLKAQVEELKKQLDGCRIVFLESAKENDSLKAQLEIAVKALEYYGSISLGESGAWCFRKKFCFDLVQTEDMQFLLEPIGKNGEKYAIGGKLARQALTAINEIINQTKGPSES